MTSYLLKEDGGYLLQENGDKIAISFDLTQSLNDNINLTENLSKLHGYFTFLTDNLTLIENIIKGFVRKITDTITSSETFLHIKGYIRSFTETLNNNEIFSFLHAHFFALLDGFSFSDKVKRYKNGCIQYWKVLSKTLSSIWSIETKAITTWNKKIKSVIRWTKK